jgi:hypothetical protein
MIQPLMRLYLLLIALCVAVSSLDQASANEPSGQVYVLVSQMNGKWPIIGPIRHASVAVCPYGVSPVVMKDGKLWSNATVCEIYGTQTFQRGFQRERPRQIAYYFAIRNASASKTLRNVQQHNQLNIPVVHDCRHHVAQVTGLSQTNRPLRRWATPLR